MHAHSLATFASTCMLPFEPNYHFTAEVKHRLVVPNNIKDWQVFEDDAQINNFLTLQHEFSGLNIDVDSVKDTQPLSEQDQTAISLKTANLRGRHDRPLRLRHRRAHARLARRAPPPRHRHAVGGPGHGAEPSPVGLTASPPSSSSRPSSSASRVRPRR